MADTSRHAVSATDATTDNPPNVPIAIHLPTLIGYLVELHAAIELADGGAGDYLAALEMIESTHAELTHIASDAGSTARMPVGICGARMHDSTNPRFGHRLYVCTKLPGHVEADDPSHYDGVVNAPAGEWQNPTA